MSIAAAIDYPPADTESRTGGFPLSFITGIEPSPNGTRFNEKHRNASQWGRLAFASGAPYTCPALSPLNETAIDEAEHTRKNTLVQS